MSRIPQVLVTLSPSGELQAELPYSGGRRTVIIESIDSLRTMLAGQLRQTPSTIGLDGSPTSGQVVHWEQHQAQGLIDPDCPWCIADEMGIDTSPRAYQAARRALHNARARSKKPTPYHYAGDGSVKVTVLKTRDRRITSSSKKEAKPIKEKVKKIAADFSAMFK